MVGINFPIKNTMNTKHSFLMLAFCLALGWTFFSSNSSNPPNGRTGAPGDGLCSDCHGGNNPNNFDGSVSFEGLPATLEPNTTYPITVTVSNPNGAASRAGFQWVALNESENNAGSMANEDGTSNIVTAGGRTYHEHAPAQFFAGNTELSWTVDWTSPDAGSEDENITFYGVGLIGNGGGTAGDLVTTSSTSIVLPAASIPLTASITSQTDVLCNGETNGSATVSAQGGQEPYTYAWSDDQTTPTASNLAAGTIGVTVTDANGASIETSATINEPAALNAQTSTTDVSCNGASDGSITVVATGGTPPYNIQGTGQDLPAGSYNFTIVDANGCELQVQAAINEPEPLQIEVIEVLPTSCFGNMDGSITYQLTGGSIDGDTLITLNNLGAGSIPISVTDDNGCFAEAEVQLESPTEIVITVDSTNATSSDDGAIFITVEGGTPNYSYEWYLNGELVGTTEDIEGLIGGEYEVVVTDDNGCEQSTTALVDFIFATNEINGLEDLSLFPNPVSDQLTINFTYTGKQQLQVQLLDAQGRIIQQQAALMNNVLDVRQQASGLYFARITDGVQSVVRKVIIE